MNYQSFVGIDISKRSFDVAVRLEQSEETDHRSFANTPKGYKALARWLVLSKVDYRSSLFCLENTGIYHRRLVRYLLKQEANVWVQSPLEIKRSLGLQRGKSDKADARRICQYAQERYRKARLYGPRESRLQRIADLMALRDRLVNYLKGLRTPVRELASIGLIQESEQMRQACEQSLKTIKAELGHLESLIQRLISEDERLNRAYQSAVSVQGVGFVAAVRLLICTDAFRRFDNPKELASYAGIAPFGYQSGTSLRARDRVHPFANKVLKAALHMCALNAIRCNAEIKAYYLRKVAEGKHKMLVLNAVRNKLLHRVCACVKQGRTYTPMPVTN